MTAAELKARLGQIDLELRRFNALPPAARARFPNFEQAAAAGRVFVDSASRVLEMSGEAELEEFLASPQVAAAVGLADSLRVAVDAAETLTRSPPHNPNKRQFRH